MKLIRRALLTAVVLIAPLSLAVVEAPAAHAASGFWCGSYNIGTAKPHLSGYGTVISVSQCSSGGMNYYLQGNQLQSSNSPNSGYHVVASDNCDSSNTDCSYTVTLLGTYYYRAYQLTFIARYGQWYWLLEGQTKVTCTFVSCSQS